MDEPTTQNTPIAAPTVPQDAPIAPEASVSAPYSIPPNYTPEMAKARMAELQTDRAWVEGYNKGGVRENAEFDALLRHSLGEAQPEPQVKPPEVESPPADPSQYRLHEVVNLSDEGKAELAELQGLAHAAALPTSWFQMISHQAAIDASRYAGMDDGAIGDRVDEQLRTIFRGDDYDLATKGALAIVNEMERKQPGLRDRLAQMGLNHNVSLLTWLMQRGLARAQT